MVYPAGPSHLTEATVVVVVREVVVERSADNTVVCVPSVCGAPVEPVVSAVADAVVVLSIVLEPLPVDIVEDVSLLEVG